MGLVFTNEVNSYNFNSVVLYKVSISGSFFMKSLLHVTCLFSAESPMFRIFTGGSKCGTDLDVMGSNPCQVKLGMHHTSKSYLNQKVNILNQTTALKASTLRRIACSQAWSLVRPSLPQLTDVMRGPCSATMVQCVRGPLHTVLRIW